MSEFPENDVSRPIEWLLEGATRGRIAIFLFRNRDRALTVDQIDRQLPVISKQRIQQVLQEMFERGAVEREVRETNKPGPNPFEYRLSLPLIEFLDEFLGM